MRRIIQATDVFQNCSVVNCFVDFSKAFDSLDREYLVESLVEHEIPAYLIRGPLSRQFLPTLPRHLRRDTLVPFLFVIALNSVISKLRQTHPRIGLRLQERLSSREPEINLMNLPSLMTSPLLLGLLKMPKPFLAPYLRRLHAQDLKSISLR